MPNTYLNDTYSSSYPFLPYPVDNTIPDSFITCISFCIYGEYQVPSQVVLTGVDVSDTFITLVFCNQAGNLICRTQTDIQTNTTTVDPLTSGISAAVCISFGLISTLPVGSYACHRVLDPSTVHIMTDTVEGTLMSVSTPSSVIQVGEKLSIQFSAGLVSAAVSTGGTHSIHVAGVPRTGKYTRQDELTYADQWVPSVPSGTLPVHVLSIKTESPEGTASSDYITYQLDNAALEDSAGHLVVSSPTSCATILTVVGSNKFPSCYGDTDEAAQPEVL